MFAVVFGEFDWHDIVVFQRCNIFKMTFKMAAITGRGITRFCYSTLHEKNNRHLIFVVVMFLSLFGESYLSIHAPCTF